MCKKKSPPCVYIRKRAQRIRKEENEEKDFFMGDWRDHWTQLLPMEKKMKISLHNEELVGLYRTIGILQNGRDSQSTQP